MFSMQIASVGNKGEILIGRGGLKGEGGFIGRIVACDNAALCHGGNAATIAYPTHSMRERERRTP